MLKHLTVTERETFERLQRLFVPADIKFTLVGGAACREYGLSRSIKDLDFVISPYPKAVGLLAASLEFIEHGQSDTTRRTCTRKDVGNGVLVDLVTGGIRITDRAVLEYAMYSDPLRIPQPSGCGDLIPLDGLIEMKLNAIVSGVDTQALGATNGGRKPEEVLRDMDDIKALISIHNLARDMPFEHSEILRAYQDIFDGAPYVSRFQRR